MLWAEVQPEQIKMQTKMLYEPTELAERLKFQAFPQVLSEQQNHLLDTMRREYHRLGLSGSGQGNFYFRDKVDLGFEKALEPAEDFSKDWLNDI